LEGRGLGPGLSLFLAKMWDNQFWDYPVNVFLLSGAWSFSRLA
jgi:hypothetical protein